MTAVGDAHYMAREPINPGPDVVPEKQPSDIPSPGPDMPEPTEPNPDLPPQNPATAPDSNCQAARQYSLRSFLQTDRGERCSLSGMRRVDLPRKKAGSLSTTAGKCPAAEIRHGSFT